MRRGGGVRTVAQLSFATSSSSQTQEILATPGPFPTSPVGAGSLLWPLSSWVKGEMEMALGAGVPWLWREQEEVWVREARGPSLAALILKLGALGIL